MKTMLYYILKLYQKNKYENSKMIFNRIMRLPIYVIILFLVLIFSSILSFVSLEIFENLILNRIMMAVELISTIVLAFVSEKYSIDNSKVNMDEYINDCACIYKNVFQKYLKTEEQLSIMLERVNNEIAALQIKIDKRYDALMKINQILIVPIILAIITGLWDSTLDISVLIESSLIAIPIYLTLYAIIIAVIKILNYDIAWRKDNLQSLADDLQGIYDIMVTFKLSNNLLISSEESEVNNENGFEYNNEENG